MGVQPPELIPMFVDQLPYARSLKLIAMIRQGAFVRLFEASLH